MRRAARALALAVALASLCGGAALAAEAGASLADAEALGARPADAEASATRLANAEAPGARRVVPQRPRPATRLEIASRPDFSAPALAAPPAEAAALAPEALRGLCADPRLEGALVDPVEAPGNCGIPLPVRVDRVLGVALEPPVTVNCRTARALATWVERGPARAAPKVLGAPLEAIRIGGDYACRTRNFRPEARLSEHAAGNAVDVAGFRLADGREASPARDWREGTRGAFLMQAWRAACGPFGTVLGPDHDAVHADHFHLDTASRSAGPTCR